MNDIEMYGISRVDDNVNRTYAWRVSIVRRGRKHVKNFPDRSIGSKRYALAEAKKYRDQLISKHPPISRRDFCNRKRRNNQSGITGVYKYGKPYFLKDGTMKKTWYWEASWPDEVGKNVSATFSINKYGEVRARELAIKAREKGLTTVTGLFWSSAPGDRSKLNKLK